MPTIRLSTAEDVPAICALWQTAFGDSDAYIGNFMETYYRPERVILLEEGGTVRSMTAWFDTSLVLPGRGAYRAAYLYAVATRPDCRGKGCSSRLLAWADGFFRTLSIPAVTTVPAQPSLRGFFGRGGFRACFVLVQRELGPEDCPAPTGKNPLRRTGTARYGQFREGLLAGLPHIAYPDDALGYQAGCCELSGGGLFAGGTAEGPVCLCAERGEDGTVVVKELLGSPGACREALAHLFRTLPGERAVVRGPAPEGEAGGLRFGMLKWLDREMEAGWDWSSAAYLGLAFD